MEIKKLKKKWYILFISLLLMIAGIAAYATQVTYNGGVYQPYVFVINGVRYGTGVKYLRDNGNYKLANDNTTEWGRTVYDTYGTFVNNESAVYCLEHDKDTPNSDYTNADKVEINLAVYYAIYGRQQDLNLGMANFDAEYYVRQLLVWYFVSGDDECGEPPCKIDGKAIRTDHNGLPDSGIYVVSEDKKPIVQAYYNGIENIRKLVKENKDKETLKFKNDNNGVYEAISYNKNYLIARGLELDTAANIQSNEIKIEGWVDGESSANSEIKFKESENSSDYITSVTPGQEFVALIPVKYDVNKCYIKGYITDAKKASGEVWLAGVEKQQKIIKPTLVDVPNTFVTAKLHKSEGLMTVHKQDIDTKSALKGAKFQIYRMYQSNDKPNDSRVKEYISPYDNKSYWVTPVSNNYTDANGNSDFRLTAGIRYRILEVVPPDGYQLPTNPKDLNKEIFIGTDGKHETVIFEDEKIKDSDVYIKKVSTEPGEDGEPKRLKGAVFTVEDISDTDKDNSKLTKDGSQNTDPKNLLEWTTNERGVIKAPALNGHRYRITEVQAPAGYKVATDNVKTIVIDPKTIWNVVEFQDPKVKGTLLIKKVSKRDPNTSLEGVEFKLLNSKGNVVKRGRTNKAGKLLFKDLDLGKYKLVETKTIPGYIIPNDLKNGIEVEVKSDDEDNLVTYPTNSTTGTVSNEKITGKVAIKKVDEETGKPVKGTAIYGLYSDSACTQEVDKLTSVDGALSNESKEVEYGTYYLKEIQAPDGYELSSKVTPVNINQPTTKKTYIVTVSDAPKRIILRLFKKDSKEEKYLAGAGFQLYKINDDGTESKIAYTDGDWVLQDTFYTNSDGYLEIPYWLRYGKYKLVEVQAPEGYNKIKDIEITLDGNTKLNSVGVASVTVDNDKILGNVKLTKVKGSDNVTVPNTSFALYRVTDKNIMYGYKGDDGDADKNIKQGLESLVTEGKQFTIKNIPSTDNKDPHPSTPVIDSITVDKDFPQPTGQELNVKANIRGPKDMKIKFVVGDLNGNEFVRQDFSEKTEAKISFSSTGSKRLIVIVRWDDNGTIKYIRGSIFFQIVAASDKINAKDLEKPLQVIQNTPTIYEDQPNPNVEEKNVYNQTILVKENLNGVEYVDSYVTGEDGSLEVNDLPYGYYFFVEEKVDEPCVQDTTPIVFKVAEQGKTLEYTMHNNIITKFELTKTDISDGKLLPNTEFAIYGDDKKTVVDSGVTDENGIATFWLTPGTYYYQEIKAPEGYQIDTGLYEFTVNDNDTVVKAHMTNSKQGFIITKTDVSDGTLLPNTEFAIYKDDKTTIITTGVTDEKGEAKFSLGTGTYYYQEIKAPEGYQIDNGLYQFVIKENDEIVRAHMTNTKLPRTGTVLSNDKLPLEITLAVVMLSGLVVFFVRKKVRNK